MSISSRWLVAALVVSVPFVPSRSIGRAQAAEAAPCDEYEVEYLLAANLELSETPLGQGNGVYRVGPGTTVVRFEQRDGVPTGAAKLVSYGMTVRFTVHSTTLFWNTHVATDAKSTVSSDDCGVIASGMLSNRKLEWKSDVRGARTDGTVNCEGSLCGKFGAPPAGMTPLHEPPRNLRFRPWVFAPDMKSFTMAKTWIAHSDSPRHTAHVALAGREIRRTCVRSLSCGATVP